MSLKNTFDFADSIPQEHDIPQFSLGDVFVEFAPYLVLVVLAFTLLNIYHAEQRMNLILKEVNSGAVVYGNSN